MTWRKFAEAIQKSGITNDVPWRIVSNLFEAAGSRKDLNEQTVRSWLTGARNCNVRTYFPDQKIEVKRIFSFFRNRPKEKLAKLQEVFQMEADNNDNFIGVNADDMDTFCWGLVNQFLDLLGLQRTDIPPVDTTSKTESAENGQSPATQKEIVSEGTAPNQQQEPPHGPIPNCTNISPSKKRSIKSLLSPHSEDCCYRCSHWHGHRPMWGLPKEPTYGVCIKYNRENQLSSDPPCKDYKKLQIVSSVMSLFPYTM